MISPQSYHKRQVMAAEIEIYCIQSSKVTVEQALKTSIQNGDSSLLGDYMNTEDRCK